LPAAAGDEREMARGKWKWLSKLEVHGLEGAVSGEKGQYI